MEIPSDNEKDLSLDDKLNIVETSPSKRFVRVSEFFKLKPNIGKGLLRIFNLYSGIAPLTIFNLFSISSMIRLALALKKQFTERTMEIADAK